MESLKKMFELENDLSYIKDFHYVFQTKNISLNYPVAKTEKEKLVISSSLLLEIINGNLLNE